MTTIVIAEYDRATDGICGACPHGATCDGTTCAREERPEPRFVRSSKTVREFCSRAMLVVSCRITERVYLALERVGISIYFGLREPAYLGRLCDMCQGFYAEAMSAHRRLAVAMCGVLGHKPTTDPCFGSPTCVRCGALVPLHKCEHIWEPDPGSPYLTCLDCGAYKPDPQYTEEPETVDLHENITCGREAGCTYERCPGYNDRDICWNMSCHEICQFAQDRWLDSPDPCGSCDTIEGTEVCAIRISHGMCPAHQSPSRGM